jgi:hypothetical protein
MTVVTAFAGLARAQDESASKPTFSYGVAPASLPTTSVTNVVWKAMVQGGLTLASGTASVTTFSGGAHASRDDGENRLQLDVAGLFARSKILAATDLNGDKVIEPNEVGTATITSGKSYSIAPRYDRFFTTHNSGYLLGFLGADFIAGKSLQAGGQIGYSRQILKSDSQELDTELGYDYSFLQYTAPGTSALNIHSARVFVGYTVDLTKDTNLAGSIEALDNLNALHVPITINIPSGHASTFQDLRLNGNLALTTTLWKDLSFRFAVGAKFDNVPAPLPPFSLPFSPGPTPNVKKLETLTQASLVVNFF